MKTDSPAPDRDASGPLRREWLVLLAVFLAGIVIVLSRKPDVLYNPQFYIEDGREWYSQAHDLGPLRAMLIPHRGYFVLVQRLIAALALAVPLERAPLIVSLCSAAVDVLPAVLLASSRFARLVPSLPARLLLGFVCLAAPDAWSLMANASNSMWYLAVAACLVVLADAPTRRAWRAFDLAVVIVSGLSGPFAILLAPVAGLKWWLRRERWGLGLLLATAATGLVQLASVLVTPPEPEGRMALGADALKFGKLLVKRVIYEALFGQAGGTKIFTHEWGDFWTHRWVLGAVGLAGLCLFVYVMARAPLELRLFVVFAGLTFLSALAWPGGTPVGAIWWDLLVPAGNGNRYFLVPVLAFLFACAWTASAKSRAARAAGVSLLAVATFGAWLNWREPPYANYDFPAAVRRYKATPAGARLLIATPPDDRMYLTKRPDEPVVVEPEECTAEVPVATTVLASNQVALRGRAWCAEGGDPHVIYGLSERRPVCGVRVRFVLTTPANAPALLQAFWAASMEEGFSADARNGIVLVPSGPQSQTAVFSVHDTIDRIRLDPGIEPGTTFQLEEVVLLTEPLRNGEE